MPSSLLSYLHPTALLVHPWWLVQNQSGLEWKMGGWERVSRLTSGTKSGAVVDAVALPREPVSLTGGGRGDC